jgi:hypothetical protein
MSSGVKKVRFLTKTDLRWHMRFLTKTDLRWHIHDKTLNIFESASEDKASQHKNSTARYIYKHTFITFTFH